MTMPKLQASRLSHKLLLIYLPLTVVAVLAVFAVLEVDYFHKEQARLMENLARVANTQGTAVEAAVWEFDLQHLRDILEKQTHLPFLQSIVVHGGNGEVLAAVGDLERSLRSPEFRMERPLSHPSQSGSRTIGRLVVTVNDDDIREELFEHLKINGSILLALVVTLVAGTLHGVRVVIGRPLEEFRNAIERPMEAQIQSPLVWTRDDELGEVLRAYNDMLEGRNIAEIATRKREDDLRLAVKLAQESGAEAARFNRLAIDRELRMLELKKQVNGLLLELGRPPVFDPLHEDSPVPSEVDLPDPAIPRCQGPTAGEQTLETLLDMGNLKPLFEAFSMAMGVPAAIVDLDGKVLAASNWQRVCTGFHRTHAMTSACCIESDASLAHALAEGREYALHRCKNGLSDAAAPIMVHGRHLANMFVGQLFLQPPDWAFFRARAQAAGFDEHAYLTALAEVPVMDEQRLTAILGFLIRLANLVASQCMERLQARQSETDMRRGRLAALSLAEDAQKAREELADYQKHLESLVEERTAELRKDVARRRLAEAKVQEKMVELEQFTSVAVGRELRMIALKEEVNALCADLGRQPPYEIVD
ncbi:MAG: PocR ligand-binding domain-containing protein [Magnetococcales bacterium]|nr:PocR ligand-binding domain-containing protein [Magnetococcales bacterium]MBF0150958.1 PocR ligand-binding domain-containing protein [Magnetococcales bacterium]MBF0631537.1 PocR ligand-binding domain-containing protein [Magnetococcales bacterium]